MPPIPADPERVDAAFAAVVEPYFDAAYYLAQYPDAAVRVASQEFRSAFEHYLVVGHEDGHNPNSDFDEAFYLRGNPDVEESVRKGSLRCGFHHYVLWGRSEGRKSATQTGLVCVVDAIEGNEIRGWAANLADASECLELVVLISGAPVGRVVAERSRADLLSVLPNATHGFSFRVPHVYCDGVPRSLALRESRGRTMAVTDGPSGRPATDLIFRFRYDDALSVSLRAEHTLSELAAKLGELRDELAFVRRLSSLPLSDYRYYFDRHGTLSPHERDTLRRQATELAFQPTFSILLPTYDTDLRQLDRAIGSVLSQTYGRFELCIADDASRDEAVRDVIRRFARTDPRIRFTFARENGGLAVNTNRALALATGEYVAFLDHDDFLAPDALQCMALSLQHQRYAMLYSDEDLVDEADVPLVPHLKPDLDPDFLMCVNYVCHFLVIDRKVVEAVGGLREGFDGCQDRDLVLRVLGVISEADVFHVPRVLYHWRVNPRSTSQTAENRAAILRRSVRSVREHLVRMDSSASVDVGNPALFSCRVTWPVPTPAPKVSVIIPTKDRIDLLGPCLTSLLRTTKYPDFEVLVVNHESTEKGTMSYLDVIGRDPRVRILDYAGAFNWASLNNVAAGKTDATVLVFLNNDTIVIEPDWLSEMVAHVMRPEVGVVGARLLYEDGTVQHAGVVLGVGGFAGHAFQRTKSEDPGYLGRSHATHRVSAVTGACLACRKAVFDEVNGFDAAEFAIGLNDVDFCLRVGERGYRTLYVPHAVLYHLESKSRGYDADHAEGRARLGREVSRLRARWGDVLDEDRWYNPAFDLQAPPYERLRVRERLYSAEDAALAHRTEKVRELRRAPAADQDRKPA